MRPWLIKFFFILWPVMVCLLAGPWTSVKASAQESPLLDSQTIPTPIQTAPQGSVSSKELVSQSWAASGKKDLKKLAELYKQCLDLFGRKAKEQQASLQGFPPLHKVKDYQALNDAATCQFIYAEALMHEGKTEKAKTLFEEIIEQFPSAQAWDPRGWYWSVAEKSQASIDGMEGKVPEEEEVPVAKGLRTYPQIHFKGEEDVIDYVKYGQFLHVGTRNYMYQIADPQGLSNASGEGIYPNTGAILKNPGYKKALKEGRLEGSHWDFVHTEDLEAAYYKWATAPEPWGVKLFYLGIIFEKAKMYIEALKEYHSLVVHFPNSVAWTYWQTPWYPGQAAIAKIKHILREHPELNLEAKWMKVEILNGFDNDIKNDVVITYPGVIQKVTLWNRLTKRLTVLFSKLKMHKIKKTIGQGPIKLVQYENGHWQLLVNNKPYLIRGLTYAPTQIGQSPDNGTLENWMSADANKNGRIDGPWDSWVDKNRNNLQDPDEPVVGDFQLMKEMGVNTLRIYHQPFKSEKEVLRALFEQFGIRVIMGDFLGKYTLGSGASWFEGTDYENPQHKKNMLESVKKMVMDFKDEPYILMWLLGNENNYGVACNADKKPEAYYRFVNEVAQWIKSVDPVHPVAMGNGDTLYLDIFAKNAPDVDIFGANVYRGDYGFGSFWEQVYDATGKPAFITEYGCPAFGKFLSEEEAEEAQAAYHRGNWLDIEANTFGTLEGVGNTLGGVVFAWIDEWWKGYEPDRHDKSPGAIGPFPGGYYFEEWYGVTSQGNGSHSPFLRQLRRSYFTYKTLWH